MVYDKLVCQYVVLPIGPNSSLEEVVQVHKVGYDGLICCHVGFAPRRLFPRFPPKLFEGMVLRVVEDLRVSRNTHERARSHHFHGIVKCEVVNDDRYSGRDILDGEPCDVSFRNSDSDSDSNAKQQKSAAQKRLARKRRVTNSDVDNDDDDSNLDDNIPLTEIARRKKAQKSRARTRELNMISENNDNKRKKNKPITRLKRRVTDYGVDNDDDDSNLDDNIPLTEIARRKKVQNSRARTRVFKIKPKTRSARLQSSSDEDNNIPLSVIAKHNARKKQLCNK
jgi:hypothetical protein